MGTRWQTSERGQSLVETVVLLPVLLTLFLGLFYLKDLVDTRSRAVEAARYVAWESTWYVRESSTDRAMKNAQTLTQDLRAMGLGRHLSQVGTPLGRTLGAYTGAVDGDGAQFFFPQIFVNLLPGGGSDGAAGQFLDEVLGAASGVGNFLFQLGGAVAFVGHDVIAGNTGWIPERDQSVITVGVRYGVRPAGFFARLPPQRIEAFSSLLSHPYNIVRREGGNANRDELAQLIGPAGLSCFAAEGHIHDLWLFPSGDTIGALTDNAAASALSTGLMVLGDAVKCVVSAPGGAFSELDAIFGTALGYKSPDGTMKDFPEKDGPASSTSEDSSPFGSGVGGCEGGGPLDVVAGQCE